MWVSVIVSLLTAIFKAFPSIESIIKIAFEEAEKSKRAEALQRKEEKDAKVDKAIDNGVGNDCEND